jgi:hypothetical protein
MGLDFLAGRLRWGNGAAPDVDGRDSAAVHARAPVRILPAGRDRTIAYVMMVVAGVCWILILSAVAWSLFWWWLRLGLS